MWKLRWTHSGSYWGIDLGISCLCVLQKWSWSPSHLADSSVLLLFQLLCFSFYQKAHRSVDALITEVLAYPRQVTSPNCPLRSREKADREWWVIWGNSQWDGQSCGGIPCGMVSHWGIFMGWWVMWGIPCGMVSHRGIFMGWWVMWGKPSGMTMYSPLAIGYWNCQLCKKLSLSSTMTPGGFLLTTDPWVMQTMYNMIVSLCSW